MLCVFQKLIWGSCLTQPLLVAQGTLWHSVANGLVSLAFPSSITQPSPCLYACLLSGHLSLGFWTSASPGMMVP